MGKPVHIAKKGSVRVPVYKRTQTKKGVTYISYVIDYRTTEGRRAQKALKNFEQAKEFAAAKAEELQNGQTKTSLLNARELQDFQAAYNELRDPLLPLGLRGKTLAEIVRQAKSIANILPPGVCPVDAASDYLRRNARTVESKTITDLLPAFLEHKQQLGLTTKHLRDLQNRLEAAAGFFGLQPIHTITAERISEWIYGLKNAKTGKPIAAQTKVNLLAALSNFFGANLVKKHLPDSWSELDKVDRPKVIQSEPDIYSIEQITTLLYAAEGHMALPTEEAKELAKRDGYELEAITNEQRDKLKELVPFLAIGFFGSTRNCRQYGEISRLDWSKVDLEEGYIHVKGKTGGRVTPMMDNLKDWLRPYAKVSGPVTPPDIRRTTDLLWKLTGIKWKHNGLRKTCLTYNRALTEDSAKVAEYAGNSKQMVQRRYSLPRTKKSGERWANIFRPKAENVVSMPKVEQAAEVKEKSV